MISTFTALIDANVFYGARLRSLVLFVAQTKLFRARWTNDIHDEWVGNLLLNRSDLKAQDLDKTRNLMNAAVPDCLVCGYEKLIPVFELPDPDDRHIVAAAVLTRANVIVTFNQKDFPEDIIGPYRLHTKHPDDFLLDAYSLQPQIFVGAVKDDFQHYKAPPLDFPDYIESLRKAGVPKIADVLEPLELLITS